MSGDINWKKKYQDLKAKYMGSVDMAFRLGFEEGGKQASQDQAMQQQQQAQEAAQNAPPGGGGAAGGMGGEAPETTQPGDDTSAPMPGGATPAEAPQPAVPMAESEHPDGSELDQHIAKLESMLSKSELEPSERSELMKSVEGIRAFRREQVQAIELKKSHEAIKGIALALHRPAFKVGSQANHNMTANAKQAVSMQEKIVTDVMSKWADEEARGSKDILAQLGIQGVTKKD
jgi:hypothetical protein